MRTSAILFIALTLSACGTAPGYDYSGQSSLPLVYQLNGNGTGLGSDGSLIQAHGNQLWILPAPH
jgi:hypothetical protein